MANSAEFKVILTIDSQGNAKIEEVKKALGDVEQGAKNANQGGAAAADEFAGAMMRQLGIAALVTAGFYKLEQVAVGAFKAGIQAVDDYKLTTIGVAATLTDMAQDQSKGQDNYTRALAYSKDMFNELELAAARYFASGKEMTQAWNILAQKGIVLRKEEIDSLGVIVDRIKLSTQGQVSSMQIAQEMRALLTGQARTTDQIGMLLKDRIPNLEQEIAKHRQIGDLVTWLGDQFKGLQYASQDIQGTLESQKSTLDTLLTQVGRDGLEGAYTDIAGWIEQANEYLRTHRDILGRDIANDWVLVKGIILSITDLLQSMGSQEGSGRGHFSGLQDFLSDATIRTAQVRDLFIYMAAGASEAAAVTKQKLLSTCDAEVTGAFNAGIAVMKGSLTDWKDQAIRDANAVRYAIMNAQPAKTTMHVPIMGGEPNYGEPEHRLSDGPPPPKTGTGSGKTKKGSGGGSGRDTTDTLENLILQLRQEEAKLTEGAFAGVDAWYVKITEKIRKLAMDDGQLKDGMLAAAEAKAAKEQKISDDLNKKYLQATHQTTAAQEADDKKLIDQMAGHPKELQQAWDIYYSHKKDQADKLAMAENQQQKGYYDSLASASLLIADQVAWKERSWQLEKEISREQLEQWFVGKDINEAKKDEYRSMLALTNQAKEYNLARQKAVDLGTMEGWAIERAGEALKRDRATIKDMMNGAESFGADALGQAAVGTLSKDKQSLKDIGKNIVQSMILEMNKRSFTKVWDNIAKLLQPKATKTTAGISESAYMGGSTGQGITSLSQVAKLQADAAKGSVYAAQQLNQSAGKLTGSSTNLSGSADAHTQAAGGLGLSGAQLGLSAGGLALSAIGVMTGSEALVYAGTVLQMAALAIEVAAMLLKIAAAMDMIPFFHSGSLVAHSGLLVAHSGLDLDERLVKVQTGEGIIKRGTMADYARAGISFDDLNNGRLPVIDRGSRGAGPDGLNGSTVNNYDNKQATINVGDIHVHAYDMTPQEAEKFVDRKIMPAINKKLGDRARTIYG